MASFDFANTINVQIAVSSRTLTATNVNSAAIDTLGYGGIAFVTSTGVNINGVPAVNIVAIRVGSDTNVTNSTAIDSAYITKSPVAIATANTTAWSGIGALGGTETTRYVFVTVNAGASNTNGSVLAVLGFAQSVPTT
jgi:hypothetical protein